MTRPPDGAGTSPDGGPVRVLVVDDQTLVRESLTGLLTLLDGVAVVGAAADGAEAVRLARELNPDVVLMDLVMPGVDGIAATTRLTREVPSAHVLVLTTYDDETSVEQALRAGAVGYVTKDITAENLARAVHLAHTGTTALAGPARRVLVEALRGRSAVPGVDDDPTPITPGNPDQLTAREVDVLRAMAAGLTNTEIAATLHLSTSTVKTHINNLFAKAHLTHRGQAVAYAYRHGLTPPTAAPAPRPHP